MKPELDEIDNKVMALLMDNARLPVTSIARQVGIARTTVIARIAALEKRGIIAGYGVRLNQKMVQPAVRAYVGLSVEARYAASLIRFLQQLPEARASGCSLGRRRHRRVLHPDRLRHPVRRTADGGWQEIGWDEAFDLVASRLLEVRELRTHFFTDDGEVKAVDGLTFEVGDHLFVVHLQHSAFR